MNTTKQGAPADLKDYMIKHKSKDIENYCREQLQKSPIDLYKLIEKARELTLKEAALKRKSYMTKNWMADTMSGNMIGLANDNYPDLIHKDNEGCTYLLIDKNLRIYLKKLDGYLPKNVITDSVLQKRGGDIIYDDEKIHIVYAGYVVDNKDWAVEFKGIFISYINEYYPSRPEWVIDLADYKKSNSKIEQFNATNINLTEEKLVKVNKDKDKAAQ